MSVWARIVAGLTALTLAACTVPRPVPQPAADGTAKGAALTPAQLLAAVQHDADGIDRTSDSAERTRLLATATINARQCLALAPDDGVCLYAQAQVLGLTARERPLQAVSLLKDMLASLVKAEARDPALDHAGPARLSAIVLMRAPPWPLGPGDVDAALAAAQRAVGRDAAYPPNLIALGQAQAKSGGGPQARATFTQAQLAVQAWADEAVAAPGAAADRARWNQEVEQALRDLR